jgi:hypothetical protein
MVNAEQHHKHSYSTLPVREASLTTALPRISTQSQGTISSLEVKAAGGALSSLAASLAVKGAAAA